MLSLPQQATNPIKLADWIEINALSSDDLNYSSGDLISALQASGYFQPQDKDAIENKVLEVFTELETRADISKAAYPYAISGGLLTAADNWIEYLPYVFCLLLSYFGPIRKTGSKAFPARQFECLSCETIKAYIQGDAIRFASPRKGLPSSFKDAINMVCSKYIKEGTGFKNQPIINRKDDTVDVIAWSSFPDSRTGKIIYFGNCASGHNWEDKVDELQPMNFCSQWLIDQPPSSIMKALFIPHRVENQYWDYFTRKSGIIFDRCRIAYLNIATPQPLLYDKQIIKDWIAERLTQAFN